MKPRVAAVLDTVLRSRLVLLLALGSTAVVATAFLGGRPNHQVIARFTDADGLVAGNEVRVAGVEVGQVDSVDVVVDRATGKQYAEVKLHVDDAHWPLHQGTTLAVRPKGVLSNVYVALNPGSSHNPVLEPGHVFGLDQTSSPINLDEFTNLFDPDVRTAIRTQIQEGVIALGGNGAGDLNATIHNLNPLSSDLSPLTQVLAQHTPELDQLNYYFDTITAELASEDTHLRGVIANGNTVLGVLADRQRELQSVLDHAAGTLRNIDAGLKGEEANLAALFARGPAALDKTKRTADLTTPLILYVDPYISHLDHLLYEFTSATGLLTKCNAPGGGALCADSSKDNGMIYTFRVDTTFPPPDKSAVGCGGAPVEQQGQASRDPACNNRPQTTPPTHGATGSGPAATGASPAGGLGGSGASSFELAGLLGGLFG